MKTINRYKVGILKNGVNYFEKEKIKIALENDQWIVLDVANYDKITKTKDYDFSYPRVGVYKIRKKDNETGWFKDHREYGNGVFYELYSEKEKRTSTIKKEIKEFLNEKFGYLSNIDLSFVK